MTTSNKQRQVTNQSTNSASSQSSQNRGMASSQLTAYDPAKGGIDYGLGMAAQHLYNPESQRTYAGPRVAGLSGATQAGIQGLTNNAGYDQAGDLMARTAGGEFLEAGNPYIGQVQQSVQDAVMPGINATFGRSGMTGSTTHQQHLAQGLSNGMAGHLFANYEAERARQMQAGQMLPEIYRAQAGDQITAGGILDQQNQNLINADMARFEEERTAPIRSLNEAMPYLMQAGQAFGDQNQSTFNTSTGSATSNSNTNGTTTTSSQPSMFSSILGGGMMGLSALSNPAMAGMMGGMMPRQPLVTNAASTLYRPGNFNPYATQPWT